MSKQPKAACTRESIWSALQYGVREREGDVDRDTKDKRREEGKASQ